MQPYIFPYIGYFHLVDSVDTFVIYDDVAYIKQGWINRNRILTSCTDHMFTVPLKNASSFITIDKTEINQGLYAQWVVKFLKTLVSGYKKAPCFEQAYGLIEQVLHTPCHTISELAGASIITTSRYLGIDTHFINSAGRYHNEDLKAQSRVIDICTQEGAETYINLSGGKKLYDKDAFKSQGIDLRFVQSHNVTYSQYNCTFVPWLSVIDVIMFNTPQQIAAIMTGYDLE